MTTDGPASTDTGRAMATLRVDFQPEAVPLGWTAGALATGLALAGAARLRRPVG